MAQYPKITIKLLNKPAPGKEIRIYIDRFTLSLTSTHSRTPGHKQWRSDDPQYYDEWGEPWPLSRAALYLALAFREYYPRRGVYYPIRVPVQVYGNDGVTIVCESYTMGNFTYSMDNPEDFEVTVTPVIAPVVFGITGITYAPSSENKCENVLVGVGVENGTAPYRITSHYNGGVQEEKEVDRVSGLFLDFPRNTAGPRQIQIRQLSNLLLPVVKNIPIISKLLGVNVEVNYGATEATVVLTPEIASGEPIGPFQFSIDDIVYQSSDTFLISASGNYTGYVIDKYGCKKTVEFTVDMDAHKPDPFFKIEIANPLRFVDQGYTGLKNIANTLSNEYDAANIDKRFFRQPFRVGDVIRTQFKSNYEAHEVKIYDCAGSVVDTIIPELKVKNLNNKDKRDAIIVAAGGGKSHIAFRSGNIYDPATGDVIDTYFQAGGRLPSFVRVGMLIEVDARHLQGTFEVEDIVYSADQEAWVCVIGADYGVFGNGHYCTALSTYNIEEYNIYEFVFNENAGQYYATIEATDSSTMYPDVLVKSEPIYFTDDVPVVVIDYSSEINDALIDYSTGVVFRLCVPGRMIKYQPSVEGEEFKDDLGNIFLQKSTYNRTWGIETDLIPWWLAEKVMIASRHRQLSIDGIQVINTEAPEVADRIGERNPFYQITGVYQENINISISEETGIISGARGILSGNENQVIGI